MNFPILGPTFCISCQGPKFLKMACIFICIFNAAKLAGKSQFLCSHYVFKEIILKHILYCSFVKQNVGNLRGIFLIVNKENEKIGEQCTFLLYFSVNFCFPMLPLSHLPNFSHCKFISYKHYHSNTKLHSQIYLGPTK